MIPFCEYCQQSFAKATTLETHYCDKMRRKDFLATIVGKASFFLYKEWLHLGKGTTNITNETFLNSTYFGSFVRFVRYSNRMLIPDKISFIRYMISLEMSPLHWCMDTVYINYIENLDKTYTPEQQREETRKTLHELADIFRCKPSEVFDHIEAGDCIRLLKTRKFTPWVLLFSKKFHVYVASKLTAEQRLIITETVINPTLWKNKFHNNPDAVKLMKKAVQDLGL